MIEPGKIHDGGCHCGSVRFRFTMPADPVIRRCNCTICAMKGVVMLDVPIADCKITAGEDALTLYTFGSGQARHRFFLSWRGCRGGLAARSGEQSCGVLIDDRD